jgi:hypothetical protein
MYSGNIRQKHRIATASLRCKSPVGRRFNFEVEDIGSVFPVEDKENLGRYPFPVGCLENDDMIDTGLEKVEVLFGHFRSCDF